MGDERICIVLVNENLTFWDEGGACSNHLFSLMDEIGREKDPRREKKGRREDGRRRRSSMFTLDDRRERSK